MSESTTLSAADLAIIDETVLRADGKALTLNLTPYNLDAPTHVTVQTAKEVEDHLHNLTNQQRILFVGSLTERLLKELQHA